MTAAKTENVTTENVTRTRTENGTAVPGVGAVTGAAGRGIYERLAAISAEAVVKATGRNAQGGKAMSITDVEAVIGDLCAKHGIVTRWADVSLESYDQPTREGVMRMWLRHMKVRVTNAELPDESFEDEWTDIGTNPMAAASFVRKGYYRALFHLADESDEGHAPSEGGGTAARSGSGIGDRKPIGPCEECAEEGITAKSGAPATYWPARQEGKPPQCNGYRDGVWLNHQLRPDKAAAVPVGQRGDVDQSDIPFHHRDVEDVRRRTRCH